MPIVEIAIIVGVTVFVLDKMGGLAGGTSGLRQRLAALLAPPQERR